jgi:hypothetical protein
LAKGKKKTQQQRMPSGTYAAQRAMGVGAEAMGGHDCLDRVAGTEVISDHQTPLFWLPGLSISAMTQSIQQLPAD